MANANDLDHLVGVAATNADADATTDYHGDRYTQKAESQSSAIALQRNPSITSTHSQSTGSSAAARRTTSSSGRSSTSPVFPASPALSTLSKNTSSSGSSSLNSAARMSVDDILSSSKLSLGARQKRMRMQAKQAAKNKQLAGVPSSSQGGTSIQSTQTRKPQHVSSSKYMANALASLKKQSQPSAKRRLQNSTNPQLNAGVEERKKRLAQLQQQQLQRQLSGRQQGQKKQLKRKHSLERLIKLEEESKEKGEVGNSGIDLKQPPETIGSNDAAASRGSVNNDSTSATKAVVKEIEGSGKDESTKKPSPRRSKRAKTVTSYNVTELAKTNEISSPQQQAAGEEDKSSPVAEVITNGEPKVDGNSSVTQPKGGDLMRQQEAEEEEDEPESAELALAALLSKYNACIKTQANGETSGETSISTWNVVNSFQSVLQHINLYDPECKNSTEYQKVEKGLANVLKSVSVVKREVMNRNISTSTQPAKKGESDKNEEGGEDVAQKEARLLQLIQIQAWIRMMVWNFEGKVGWEFLHKVIALADAKDEVENGTASTGGKKGGKKKGKKKKSKRKQKEEQQSKSLSTGLVEEVQALAELAPYVLPPSLDFAQWLKDTLTFGFRHAIPNYGAELFDHFEIDMGEPIALKRSGTDQSHLSHRSERSQVSHSPVKQGNSTIATGSPTKQLIEKRQQRQQAYFASLAEEIKASNNSVAADDESATITGSVSTVTSTSRASSTNREKDDTVLFKTSVSLTSTVPSRTQNPFLKGSARANYVGSHLSSKLSNITSLFREVKAPAKPKPVVPVKKEKKTKEPVLPTKVDTSTSSRDGEPVKAAATTSHQQLRQPANSKAKRMLSSTPAKETVRKRLRPAETPSYSRAAAASSCVEETPRVGSFARAAAASSCVEETPRSIIEETPAKQTRFRMDRPIMRNSLDIIAETPQQPQQNKRAGGRAVLPTNLWRGHDQRPAGASSRQPFNLANNHQRRRQQQQGRNNNGSGGEHLTPVNNTLGIGARGGLPPLNFGLSPMPHQEDMVSVMAQAAKAAADRKKKA